MVTNSRQFDRRFWKVLGVTFVQVLPLLGIALILVHFLFGHSPMSRFLFQLAPPLSTGLGIKLAMDKLRKSDSA